MGKYPTMSKQNSALSRRQAKPNGDGKAPSREVPAEEWVQSLFFKRRMGRRILPESLPPYATDEGLILTDRRSQEDRRKPIGAKPAPMLKAV